MPVNPATTGPAMVPGGITAENVRQVMHENAQRAYPGSTVRVIQTEHGTLDSNGVPKLVPYRDGTRQLHVLRNQPGVRATVAIDGQEGTRYVYSLLECGNDVLRTGGGISEEGIVFTPLSVLSLSPLNTTEEATSVTNKTKLPGVVGSATTELESLISMIPEAIKEISHGDRTIDVQYTNGSTTLSIKVTNNLLKEEKSDAATLK